MYKSIMLTLSSIGILCLLIKKGKKRLAFDIEISLFSGYIIAIIISSLINHSEIKDAISFALYTTPAIVVYLYIMKATFSERQQKQNDQLIFIIFGVQIIASIIKIVFWGKSENVIGTIHFSSGSLNTIVPLIGVSMLGSFYVFYKRSKLYLFLMVGFFFMAWTGNKRGIYFYIIILIIIAFFSYLKIIKRTNIIKLIKSSKSFLLLIPIISVIIYFGVKYTPTLNPEHRMGGSFNVNYIYNYALEYSTQIDSKGYSGGRLSGLLSVFKSMKEANLLRFFFGDGPGRLLGVRIEDRNVYSKYKLSHLIGVNGWSMALISVGFIGATIITIFYFRISIFAFKFAKKENDPYWKAIGFGTYLVTIVFFLDFFTYTRAFYHSIPLNIALLYFHACLKQRYCYANISFLKKRPHTN